MNTPDNIKQLRANEVIVVGTNMCGAHYGGLAKTAYELWGLQWGQWRGLVGKCYGFPTLGKWMKQIPMDAFKKEADKLINCAIANPDLTFLLTKVGCGIAGFKEEEIAPLFHDTPSNIIKPLGW